MDSKQGELTKLPASRYFTLERVADGVYAAIVVPGTGAWGNAGIVDLGGAALVVDSFLTPAPARDLRAAAQTLTGAPIAYVVNSHYHLDHVLGNQAFPDALVVATDQTRELMAARNVGLIEQFEAHPDELDALAAESQREPDEAIRADMLATLAEYRAFGASLSELEPRLPDITFAERLSLHGTARTAEALTYGGGHTPSDAFVLLPNERVLFSGDLVSVGVHPSFFGDPRAWIGILCRIEALDVAVVVPGHGPVGGREAIPVVRRYLEDLLVLAGPRLAQGATADELAATPVPADYASWAARDIFRDNMRFLAEYLAMEGHDGIQQ
jgi:glyoxylase-like metal-dependent hydrolase (beta-lactamase superfamily II)